MKKDSIEFTIELIILFALYIFIGYNASSFFNNDKILVTIIAFFYVGIVTFFILYKVNSLYSVNVVKYVSIKKIYEKFPIISIFLGFIFVHEVLEIMFNNKFSTLIDAFINSMMAGVFEETVFRVGIFFLVYFSITVRNIKLAAVVSSIIFAVSHLTNLFLYNQTIGDTVIQVLSAYLVGLIMLIVLIKTGSIMWGVIIHIVIDIHGFLNTDSIQNLSIKSYVFGAIVLLMLITLVYKKYYNSEQKLGEYINEI